MKKLTDEILNKYIDNELSSSELNDLKEYISQNPQELSKFKAHKLVDELLREMEHESAPENFTYNFMQKVSESVSGHKEKNYFIWFVFSFLGISFLGFFVFGLLNVSSQESSRTTEIFNKIGDGFQNLIPTIKSISFSINSDLLMVIVSALVLVTLLATYAMINSHKAFKNKIENLSH